MLNEAGQKQEHSSSLLVFGLAMLQIILCSGIVYGWAALCPLLQDQHFFSSSDSPLEVLNTVGTWGIGANAFCRLPLGLFLDTYGPRKTSMVGGGLLMVGAFLMAFGDHCSLLQISLGYFLIGFAGPFVQTPCFQFTELFGSKKGTATTALVICFELSTGGFLVFSFLYHAGSSLQVLFMGLAVVGGSVVITSCLFWPDEPNKAPPRVVTSEEDCPHRELLKKASFDEQLKSNKFAYVMCFVVVHILRNGCMLVSVGQQSQAVFGEVKGQYLAQIFSIILPLGFLPMTVFTALGLANRLLRRPDSAFIATSVTSILWALLLLVWWEPSYILCFLLFPFARQLMFSTFFAYIGTTFGYRTFGRLTGVISTFAGCVQLLAQQGLMLAAQGGWPAAPKQEANRWAIIDSAIVILPLPLLLWPIHRICKRKRQLEKGIFAQGEVYSPAEVLLR